MKEIAIPNKWEDVKLEYLQSSFETLDVLDNTTFQIIDNVFVILTTGTLKQAESAINNFIFAVQININGVHWDRLFVAALIATEVICKEDSIKFQTDKFGANRFIIQSESDLPIICGLHKKWMAMQKELNEKQAKETDDLILSIKLPFVK